MRAETVTRKRSGNSQKRSTTVVQVHFVPLEPRPDLQHVRMVACHREVLIPAACRDNDRTNHADMPGGDRPCQAVMPRPDFVALLLWG